ncbi:hypothetical protein FRC10_003798 [Ceratobasidium sp. 414]|nr:hypothetical protein FRC10_003798 [Ceratobasidium sp. 414]
MGKVGILDDRHQIKPTSTRSVPYLVYLVASRWLCGRSARARDCLHFLPAQTRPQWNVAMEAMGYGYDVARKLAAAQDQLVSIQRLRALTSGTRPLDSSALRAAYLASRPYLHYLARSEFSNLIALFGALSAYSDASHVPCAPGFIISEKQRAVLVGASTREYEHEWWGFVLDVGADQSALGRRTPDVDRYWLMLAHLGCCRAQGRAQVYHGDRIDDIHNQESGSVKMYDRLPTGSAHLVCARAHYAVLARNHLDESVHYAYLRSLLDVYPLFADARAHFADALGQLLANTRFHFEPRLTRLFWSALHAVEFTLAERQALLDALALRSSLSAHTHKHVPGTQRLNHPSSDSDEDPVLALRRAILDLSTSDEPWVRREAQVIVHEGWSSLVALAGGTPHAPRALVHPPRRINVLLGLRYLSQEKGELERLWDVWMTVLGAEVGKGELGTANIDRTILLRFLKEAAVRRSDRVLSGAGRLLPVQPCILLEQDKIQSAEVDPEESISVMLGAAWVCLGTTNLAVLLARMQAAGFKTDGCFPDAYLAKLVELLVVRAPDAAWSVVQQCRGPLPVDAVAALASTCAHAGLLDQAASLLSGTRLSTNIKFTIALVCLQQCSQRRIILSRRSALEMCDCLGPHLDHVPMGDRHTAVWMALNAGLVYLAGLMGVRWQLSRRMQRKLVVRLVRARLCGLALRVAGDRLAITRTGSSLRFARGETDATRRGNITLSRVGRRRRKRPGGRAQVRATLAVLARLVRPHTRGHNGPTTRADARLSFVPDAVTLNILCRAFARCTSGMTVHRLRAVFDQLAQTGMCGPPGNHFGTNETQGHEGFIGALAGLVRGSDARVSFVRHTRPLLKTFLRGFRARRDEEAARVVVGLLEAGEASWRSGR